jgi:DNA polymerase-4
MRKIIHVDMDAFYASVEQRDEPNYRGKPIVVGGRPEGRGGVVAAASYEARAFGVRSAMPSRRALELCPQLIFVRPRFEMYQQVSAHLRSIFRRYTDLIEPLSLDEAYLDVTEDLQGIGSALEIATRIRAAIKEELNLTASAGVSINKFVAKVASGMNKPDGLTFIGPSKIEEFMETLPVAKFFGVGKATAQRMHRMGLYTGADLKKISEAELVQSFGKSGRFFFQIVRGIDDRPVRTYREPKSTGAEDTFPEDLWTAEDLHAQLRALSEKVARRLQKSDLRPRSLTIKIRFSDFRQFTRTKRIGHSLRDPDEMGNIACKLLDEKMPFSKGIRLLGVTVSGFEREDVGVGGQLTLFP